MWDNQTIMMIVEGTGVTLYMTLFSTLIAYALGLPMGITLVVTAPGGLKPNRVIYKILDVVVNIVRSIPFLILLMLIIPFTRFIVGKSYGPAATIVPLWGGGNGGAFIYRSGAFCSQACGIFPS